MPLRVVGQTVLWMIGKSPVWLGSKLKSQKPLIGVTRYIFFQEVCVKCLVSILGKTYVLPTYLSPNQCDQIWQNFEVI